MDHCTASLGWISCSGDTHQKFCRSLWPQLLPKNYSITYLTNYLVRRIMLICDSKCFQGEGIPEGVDTVDVSTIALSSCGGEGGADAGDESGVGAVATSSFVGISVLSEFEEP